MNPRVYIYNDDLDAVPATDALPFCNCPRCCIAAVFVTGSLMYTSITEVWLRVVEGDRDAWADLVVRFSPLIYSVARRVGLDKYDAEDCAQHTWMALYRYRKSLRDPRGLPAWLIRTTHRQAVILVKRQARRIDLAADAQEMTPEKLTGSEIEQIEWRAALESAIKQLDPRCRRLINDLFYSSEDTTYKTMANSMGMSANAFGPFRSRCLKRLRKILKKMGYELH